MAEMALGRTWEEPPDVKTLRKEMQITQLEMGAEGREHHVEEGLVLHTQTHLRDW